MKESTLLKIALICALMGLVILYFISERISLEEATVEKITHGNVGDVVRIMGVVKSVTNAGNVTFLTIENPEEVEVVVFKSLNLKEGDYVEVIGEVEEYKGKREVIGNAVRVIT